MVFFIPCQFGSTHVQCETDFHYTLLLVIKVAPVIAMVVSRLSARLPINYKARGYRNRIILGLAFSAAGDACLMNEDRYVQISLSMIVPEVLYL